MTGENMFINREFTFNDFISNIYTNDFLVINSTSDYQRSKKLSMNLPTTAKVLSIAYSVQKKRNGILDDRFEVTTNYNTGLSNSSFFSLYQDLDLFISQLHHESGKVLIDISGFHLRFLGAFLAGLSRFHWDSVFCAYTEPEAYPRIISNPPSDFNEWIGHTSNFDLNSSFWGYEEIPNLKTTSNERSNLIWIAFLGFEGKRASAVYSEISGDSSAVIPVISMPAIRSGWANHAFNANQILFENANIYSHDIEYTDALDPFAAYNFIEHVHSDHPDRHIVISPLGTRPVSLGALLYAVNHEEAEIYYDTPKESSGKVLGCGEIHVYDILSFLNN